jgi:hypothetical protein
VAVLYLCLAFNEHITHFQKQNILSDIMNKFFALAAIAAITVFSSCSKDSDTAPAKVLPNSYSAKLLGAQANSNPSFFSSNTGLTYGTADSANFATNKVDVSFAQTGTPATSPKFVSLAARGAEGLRRVTTITRATTFELTTWTKAQFDTVSNGTVAALAAGGTSTVVVQQSKVYKFVNTEGKKGLIYVSNLTLGAGTDGSVTIDVKAAK